MTLFTRRILYTSATALFVAIAPAVIFYAQGYRFDPRSVRVLKTGAIRLQTSPRTLQVSIDGKAFKRASPSLLRNLLPGNYTVTLQSVGYQPWSGNVKISANSVSALDADLIRSNPDRLSLGFERVLATAFNPAKNSLAILSGRSTDMVIGVLELDKAVYQNLARIPSQPQADVVIAWSSHGKFLAVNQPGRTLSLIKPDDGTAVRLPIGADLPYQKIIWDPANDNLLYGLADQSLWQIDAFAQKTRVVASPNIVDIGFDRSSLWAVRDLETASQLQLLNPFGHNSVNRRYTIYQPVSGLLTVSSNRFLVQSRDQVIALDAETQTLRSLTLSTVSQTLPSRDAKRVLLVNREEVWLADLSALTFSLVGRYTDLNGAGWTPSEDTVLLSANGALLAVSLSNPAARAGSLPDFPNVEHLFMLNESDVVVLERNSVEVIKLF